MDKELEFVRNLARCLCGLNVLLVPEDEEEIEKLVNGSPWAALPEREVTGKLVRELRRTASGIVYNIHAVLNMNFCSLHLPRRRQYLLAGPFAETPFDRKDAFNRLLRLNTQESAARRFLDYASSMPVIPVRQVSSFCILAADRLFGVSGQTGERLPEPVQPETVSREIESAGNFENPEKIRRIESRYEFSSTLTAAVTQGNASLALRIMNIKRAATTELVRNPNPLRNAQNICIVLNTQLRCAMERNGIHPYRLDLVSGNIGTRIEKLRSLSEVEAFVPKLIRMYCSLAQEKLYPGLTPFCRLAVAYIMTHLSGNITVKNTAEALSVNPNYLSSRFRRDTGMTFIAFLNRERARQAAALLSETDMQIQQIATACGYNNSSYFTKQFAIYNHMTPREYREMAQRAAGTDKAD